MHFKCAISITTLESLRYIFVAVILIFREKDGYSRFWDAEGVVRLCTVQPQAVLVLQEAGIKSLWASTSDTRHSPGARHSALNM